MSGGRAILRKSEERRRINVHIENCAPAPVRMCLCARIDGVTEQIAQYKFVHLFFIYFIQRPVSSTPSYRPIFTSKSFLGALCALHSATLAAAIHALNGSMKCISTIGVPSPIHVTMMGYAIPRERASAKYQTQTTRGRRKIWEKGEKKNEAIQLNR